MQIGNLRLDKRLMAMIAGGIFVAVLFYLLTGPLFAKIRRVGSEVKALDSEMAAARDAIKSEERFRQAGQLLTRRKISAAIDEITQAGTAHNINFLYISPQPIIKPKGSKYPVLPIKMNVQSTYKDLGVFLGALETLEQSIVAVRSFEINANAGILPQLETNMVVEVYLQEGEDG